MGIYTSMYICIRMVIAYICVRLLMAYMCVWMLMAVGHVCSGILCVIACSSEAAGGRDAATAEGGPAAPW